MKFNNKNNILLGALSKARIEILVKRSDHLRELKSFVAPLLPIGFETPDLSRGQEHFLNLKFYKLEQEGLLLMNPDLN